MLKCWCSFHLLWLFFPLKGQSQMSTSRLKDPSPTLYTWTGNKMTSSIDRWVESLRYEFIMYSIRFFLSAHMGRSSSTLGLFAGQGWQQYNWWVNGRRWKGQSKTVRHPWLLFRSKTFSVCTDILHTKSRCMRQTSFLHWLQFTSAHTFTVMETAPQCWIMWQLLKPSRHPLLSEVTLFV